MTRPKPTPPAKQDGKLRGLVTIDQLDRRSHGFRQWDAYRSAIVDQLGGPEQVSPTKERLVRDLSTIALRLDAMAAMSLDPAQPFDLDLYQKTTKTAASLANMLGLDWAKVEVKAPSLSEILAGEDQ